MYGFITFVFCFVKSCKLYKIVSPLRSDCALYEILASLARARRRPEIAVLHCISFSAPLQAYMVQRGILPPVSGGEVPRPCCRPYVSAEKFPAVAAAESNPIVAIHRLRSRQDLRLSIGEPSRWTTTLRSKRSGRAKILTFRQQEQMQE